MASFRFKVVKGKRRVADGWWTVYLSICHHCDVRYINTGVYVPDMKKFQNERVVDMPDADESNAKLDELRRYATDFFAQNDVEGLSCIQIRKDLGNYIQDAQSGMLNRMTIEALFDWRIKNLRDVGNESYAKVHEDVKKVIIEAGGNYPLDELDRNVIRHIHQNMEKKGYTPGGISMKMAKFKAALHEAELNGMVRYLVHPFAGYKMQKAEIRQMDLTLEEFHKIQNHVSESKRVNFARDIFLLSFYFYGMNIADMLQVTFRGGKLNYVRTKTRNMKTGNKNIMLNIPVHALDVMKRITDGTKILWPCKAERTDILAYVNRGLRLLKAETGIETKISSYSARKTFCQYAFVTGTDINTIKYCIGQSFESDMVLCNGYRIMQQKSSDAMARVIKYITA